MEAIIISPVDPTSTEAAELLAASDAYQSALYPATSLHLLTGDALKVIGATFLGAYLDGRLEGCGAYLNHAGQYGELKRMFVRPDVRGLGVGWRLLLALEAHASAAGLTVLRLETGVYQ